MTQKEDLARDRLEEMAGRIGQFTARHMVDADGLVYCGLNQRTLKPFRDREIRQEQCFADAHLKQHFSNAEVFNYEDSNMATAEYLLANLYQWRVTGAPAAKNAARRGFNALKAVAEAGSHNSRGVVMPMFGFLPKPHGGVAKARLCAEVSIDQYLRVMYALQEYAAGLARPAEKAWIDRFLAGCADCWDINHYTFNYFSNIVRWGACGHHAIAFGLYCSAVGETYRPTPHDGWFKIFRSRADALLECGEYGLSDNVASLTILAMKRLCQLKPELRTTWLRYARRVFDDSAKAINAQGLAWLYPFIYKLKPDQRFAKPHWLPKPRNGETYYDFLRWRGNLFCPSSMQAGAALDLYELTGRKTYLMTARKLLLVLGGQDCLKYLIPQSPADLPKDYGFLGDKISGLNTAAWLRAYWQLRLAEGEPQRNGRRITQV